MTTCRLTALSVRRMGVNTASLLTLSKPTTEIVWEIVWWFQPTPLKNDGVKVSWDDDSIPNCFWKVIKFRSSKPPDKTWRLIYPSKMVIFHSYVAVYQSVIDSSLGKSTAQPHIFRTRQLGEEFQALLGMRLPRRRRMDGQEMIQMSNTTPISMVYDNYI